MADGQMPGMSTFEETNELAEDVWNSASSEVYNDAPIGVFDSGVGGLTVARTIVDQLPNESIIYVGDTAHAPYGVKPLKEVQKYATAIADNLVERGCKLIVIACNSASAAFADIARERYSVPIVEVIKPAVIRAIATTHNDRIGVIGTTATVDSGAYLRAFRQCTGQPSLKIYSQACPLFVPFVERGITAGRQILGITENYLDEFKAIGVDTLVLGCTHYPLLSGVIQLVMGDSVTLVSSAEETAKEVYRILSVTGQLAQAHSAHHAHRSFESTGDPARFATLAGRFLGPSITSVAQIPELLR